MLVEVATRHGLGGGGEFADGVGEGARKEDAEDECDQGGDEGADGGGPSDALEEGECGIRWVASGVGAVIVAKGKEDEADGLVVNLDGVAGFQECWRDVLVGAVGSFAQYDASLRVGKCDTLAIEYEGGGVGDHLGDALPFAMRCVVGGECVAEDFLIVGGEVTIEFGAGALPNEQRDEDGTDHADEEEGERQFHS